MFEKLLLGFFALSVMVLVSCNDGTSPSSSTPEETGGGETEEVESHGLVSSIDSITGEPREVIFTYDTTNESFSCYSSNDTVASVLLNEAEKTITVTAKSLGDCVISLVDSESSIDIPVSFSLDFLSLVSGATETTFTDSVINLTQGETVYFDFSTENTFLGDLTVDFLNISGNSTVLDSLKENTWKKKTRTTTKTVKGGESTLQYTTSTGSYSYTRYTDPELASLISLTGSGDSGFYLDGSALSGNTIEYLKTEGYDSQMFGPKPAYYGTGSYTTTTTSNTTDVFSGTYADGWTLSVEYSIGEKSYTDYFSVGYSL